MYMDERLFFCLFAGPGVQSPEFAAGIPLSIQYRMNNQVHTQVQFLQNHAGGINQERHIIIDHLHDGVLTIPTVISRFRVKDPD